AALIVVGWLIALMVIGVVLRYGSGAEALAWGALFALMPLSGVFYPVRALPGFLQPVAAILPTTHVFNAMKDVLDGKGMPWEQMAIAAATTLVMAAAVLWYLTWMLKLFRRRGYISRYA